MFQIDYKSAIYRKSLIVKRWEWDFKYLLQIIKCSKEKLFAHAPSERDPEMQQKQQFKVNILPVCNVFTYFFTEIAFIKRKNTVLQIYLCSWESNIGDMGKTPHLRSSLGLVITA